MSVESLAVVVFVRASRTVRIVNCLGMEHRWCMRGMCANGSDMACREMARGGIGGCRFGYFLWSLSVDGCRGDGVVSDIGAGDSEDQGGEGAAWQVCCRLCLRSVGMPRRS